MSGFSEIQPEPPQVDAIAGEFVTEIFAYDDGRPVTVYLPPVPPEAIVFACERTAVFGVSAGWGLALALGLRHSDLYGAISQHHPAAGTGRPAQFRIDCRERTLWPASENLLP